MNTESIKITLRLPGTVLSPNAPRGTHWAVRRDAIRAYRGLACAEAMAIGNRNRWKSAEQRATFYFTANRNRDGDNFLARLKPVWDGLQDAGVLDNDSGLVHHPVKFEIDKENPRVEIEIRESV